jgi:Domain of unknown function (DUF4287)
MTTQQSFKRRIRARMQKTGESYTAARAQLLPDPEPEYEPQYSDDAVRRNTGRGYHEWFAALDEWGAAERPHGEIARWLGDEFGIPGWWCQNVAVEYERARGLRPVRGDRDGTHNASASKTVAVPVERLFEAFAGRWPDLRQRTAQPPRTARFDYEDGATRVVVTFTAKGDGKSTAAVSHERIADAETADRLKAMWRERLARLKAELER